MSVHVPHELVIEILARLPVVSLLRFKTVCKSWYSLITSPSFVSKHFSHRKNKQFIRISKADGKQRYRLYRYDGQCGHDCSELELPIRDIFTCFDVVGSCNGLLCIWKNFPLEKSAIIVWNPSTRKSVTLPKPQVAGWFVLGFGVNPITHEYKVARIMVQYPYHKPQQQLVELYTQGTASWRRLGSTVPNCFIERGVSQAFVSGAVNWIANDSSVFVPLIVSFDMSAETFSVMMLPPPLANKKLSLSVQLFRESLAVLCGQERACSIWVMKEYGAPRSWTKLISFEVNQPLLVDRALGVGENGKVLLSTIDGRHCSTKVNRLLSYDTATKAVTDTKIRGHSFHVGPLMETLVSVESQGGVLDGQPNPL